MRKIAMYVCYGMAALVVLGLSIVLPQYIQSITAFFLWLMLCVCISDCGNRTYKASLYPTLGMLGTFVGIFWGLMQFNVATPDVSLPTLLNGLKLAFITSIFGLILAMLRRLLVPIFPIEEKTELDELGEINSLVDRATGKINNQLQRSTAALIDMNGKFDTFITQIGDNLGGQIQKSLAQALSNLTDQISEQFTTSIDNFTAAVNTLTANVDAMNQLQTQYDKRIDTMTQAAQTLGTLLNNVSNAANDLVKPLDAIKQLSANIPERIDSVMTTMGALNTATQNMNTTVATVSDNMTRLATAIGSINTNATAMTATMQAATDNTKAALDKHVELLNGHFAKIRTDYNKDLTTAGQWLTDIVQKLTTDMRAATDKASKELKPIMDKTSNELKPLVAQMSDDLQQIAITLKQTADKTQAKKSKTTDTKTKAKK